VPLEVREMAIEEVDLIIDYFHDATPEHHELLGVDPTRLPPRDYWRERYVREYEKPYEEREMLLVIWRVDGEPAGFSTCDRIVYGDQARMHLHIPAPERRRSGIGTEGVRGAAEIYFDRLALKRLVSEPNAFNVAPNRTLQAAGFRYVKTHMTVPGLLNYHQAVNRWVLERR
jgi:RimJ/RimL family protein N-acetyltransferase